MMGIEVYSSKAPYRLQREIITEIQKYDGF
jgi:hypothetical protein